jgi:methyl-accepting chemotaxis protein
MNSVAPAALGEILDSHLRLDRAIEVTLESVVSDTEGSALKIIEQIRLLYDTANNMVTYLDGSGDRARDLAAQIGDGIARLGSVGAFLEALPAKLKRDLENSRSIVKEIGELEGLVESVQTVSRQSHMLSINAAIQANQAGTAGAAFRVVADEMRRLAANSGAVSARIRHGLSRARNVVETGVTASLAESSRQLADVSEAAASIGKLVGTFQDMTSYSQERYAMVGRHGSDLAREIAEVMGHVQYQDVVRQAIERVCVAVARRNALLQETVNQARSDDFDLALLPQQLELVLNEYLTEEAKHLHSARADSDESAGPKIELF